jgi:hypothetical protein
MRYHVGIGTAGACVHAVSNWAQESPNPTAGSCYASLPDTEEAVAELMQVAEFGLPTGVIFIG